MKKTHKAITGKGSALNKYQDVLLGTRSLTALLYFEFCMVMTFIPGALGMVLRQIFWPRLFGSCGKKVTFGANVVLRQPKNIHLGSHVVVSEGCILDGRHGDNDRAIVIADDVIFSNNVMLSCKSGSIRVGAATGVNAQTIIQSTNGCAVSIGRDCILGQRCLVIGGGSYNMDQLDVPIRSQGIRDDGGVELKENVWLGANVTVVGGVTMEEGSVAGAGAVVTKNIPSRGICLGVPAQVTRFRGSEEE